MIRYSSSYTLKNNVILLLQVTQLKIDHNPFAKAFRDSPGDTELQQGQVTYHTEP